MTKLGVYHLNGLFEPEPAEVYKEMYRVANLEWPKRRDTTAALIGLSLSCTLRQAKNMLYLSLDRNHT